MSVTFGITSVTSLAFWEFFQKQAHAWSSILHLKSYSDKELASYWDRCCLEELLYTKVHVV